MHEPKPSPRESETPNTGPYWHLHVIPNAAWRNGNDVRGDQLRGTTDPKRRGPESEHNAGRMRRQHITLEHNYMQTSQGSILLSLRAVQTFLNENAAALGNVPNTGVRKRLDDLVAELNGHSSDQTGNDLASQGATLVKENLRTQVLRDHMAPIARIAKVDLPDTPEIVPLRMPRGNPTVARLAAAADGMAKAAAKHADVFIAAGLPIDFVAQLNGAVKQMLDTVSERSQSRGRVRSATTGIKETLTAGRKIVHVIDALVRTTLKGNTILLSAWDGVKRVQLNGLRRSKVAAPVTAPTPTPTPTPATTPALVATASQPVQGGTAGKAA